ncbi:MAG: hypothetical protein MK212_14805 [Saprospiraceae bacterium]|nr:hypothetical protein [Saprospiraceae bacterium]
MKIYGLMSLVVWFYMTSNSFAQEKYDRAYFDQFPSFFEILKHYASCDSDFLYRSVNLSKFEKKKEGWFVKIYHEEHYPQVKTYRQIWSAKSNKFYGKSTQEVAIRNLNTHLNHPQNLYHDQCWLCAYEQAEEDLIKLLETEQKEKMTAQELECLARAYAKIGNDQILVYHQLSSFDSTYNVQNLDLDKIGNGLKNLQKGIEYFEFLQTKFPKFTGQFNSIQTQKSNYLLKAYCSLQALKQEQLAKKLLPDHLYDTWLISQAKNLLENCVPNSILFTYRDLDTYLLTYVQDILGIRTDVTVVHLSNLNLGRYVYYLQNKKQAPLEFNLSADRYSGVNYSLTMVKRLKDSMDCRIVFDKMRSDQTLYMDKIVNSSEQILEVPFFPTTRFWIDNWMFDIGKAPLLIKEEIVLLDILTANKGKRHFYFCTNIPQLNRWGLHKYLRSDGLVYKLVEPENVQDKTVWAENVMENYRYKYIKTTADFPLAKEHENIEHQYMSSIVLLVNKWTEEEKTAEIGDLLDWLHQTFPIETYAYEQAHLFFALSCHNQNRWRDRDAHIAAYIKYLQKEITHFDAQDTAERAKLYWGLRDAVLLLASSARDMQLEEAGKQCKEEFYQYTKWQK